MSSRSSPSTRSLIRRQLKLWLIAVGGVVLLIGGSFAWSVGRPAAAGEAREDVARAAESRKLREEAAAMEKEIARITQAGVPSDADLAVLQRAVENQREWMATTASTQVEQQLRRLGLLEATLAAAQARSWSARTLEAEREARALLAQGRREPAIARLQEALDRQRSLNQGGRPGGVRDLAREASLTQEVSRWRAEPLAEELARVLAAAQERLAAGATDESLAGFQSARQLQERLNREHPGTRFADLAVLDRIETEIATLQSRPLAAEIDGIVRQAEAAAATGDEEGAAARYEEAIAARRRLHGAFPRSRLVSVAHLDALEVERQTVLSGPDVREMERLEREAAVHLRAGDFKSAAARCRRGAAVGDVLFPRHPRSRRLDPELRLRLNYLSLHADELESIHKVVIDALRPVPGLPAVRLFRTEVTQDLYTRVMRANPSRNADPALPVESVSAGDAADFCRRLGWLLGREVRLPLETEYRAALGGPVPAAALAGRVWALERSGLKPRAAGAGEPNEAGFSDLLGNVAEWLASPNPADGTAPVAGGSFADPLTVLAKVPVSVLPRHERARTLGFRIAVPGD